jgi:hypothetical protein
MRIVWIGNRETATFRATAQAIVGDERVEELIDRPLDASTESVANEIASADGVALAVHHFEPRTSAWLNWLNRTSEADRWRVALGPFAAVAARAPFDVLHRQGFLTSVGPFTIRRWLDRLSGEESLPSSSVRPLRMLIWQPAGERSGIDPAVFAFANETASVTPRTFGLPFAPDVTIAWITADLNREERVHLSQLRSATPRSRWIAVYATPAAAQRFPLKADATLVWPFDVQDLLLAVAGPVAKAEHVTSADRAA